MKKSLFILMSLPLLFACGEVNQPDISNSQPEQPNIVESPPAAEVSEITMPEIESTLPNGYSLFQHHDFNVAFPSYYLLPANQEESSQVRFTDESENPLIYIKMVEGEQKLYLDAEFTQQATFPVGEMDLLINPTGYCDGPGCSDPFMTYRYFDGQKTYFVTFYNQTQPTEISNHVLESFTLTK